MSIRERELERREIKPAWCALGSLSRMIEIYLSLHSVSESVHNRTEINLSLHNVSGSAKEIIEM